jgi:hypothetical protein
MTEKETSVQQNEREKECRKERKQELRNERSTQSKVIKKDFVCVLKGLRWSILLFS